MTQDNATSSSLWWQVTFLSQEPDESAYLLIELGADGVWQENDNTVQSYFRGAQAQVENFEKEAAALGFQKVARVEVKDQNWLQNCREIWQPVQVGKLTITPILSLEERPKRALAEHEILLIPGTGFGTGHHASTRLAMGFLQDERLNGFAPARILDLGTGSGVLALACAEQYSCPIDAMDNDPVAIENAIDNINLNNKQSAIKAFVADAATLSGKYDLIMANIYAELLIKLVPQFQALLSPNGFTILSGIVKNLCPSVETAFKNAGFCCLQTKEEGEWCSILLKR